MEKLLGEFSVGLFFWQTIIFLSLLFLLRKYAWKPVLGAIEDREKGIQDSLDAAKKAQEEMTSLKADNEKLLKEAMIEREKIVKKAKEASQEMINEAKGKASIEADKIITNARQLIQNEKMAAITELKNHVANLSVEVAEKILKEKMQDSEKQKAFVGELLEEVNLN